MISSCCLCASAPFQVLNQVTDFNETRYQHHAVGGHSHPASWKTCGSKRVVLGKGWYSE